MNSPFFQRKTDGGHAIRCAVTWGERLYEARQMGLPREAFDALRREWRQHFENAMLMDIEEARRG